MLVPVSWLRDFFTSDADAQAIADVLTARGLKIDGIERQFTPGHIVVGRVLRLTRHPDADRLLVGTVDVGGRTLQIVTGATNVAEGNKVPIALAGASLFPHGSKPNGARQPKSIQKSIVRGVQSDGMMCSATELALPGEFDDGIVILEDDAVVGEDFWRTVRFGEAVLDVDVPSNRADCLSIAGIAREAAAGLKIPYRPRKLDAHAGSRPSPLGVEIGDPAVCRRLIGQFFWNVANRQSPMWMILRLHAAGVRSLALLVDISNYVQIETGQPLHFYDAKKIRGDRIVARSARLGECVVTLDGIERLLQEGMPVIADGGGPVGVAGIMGGAESGVGDDTSELFLESPNFVGARIRRARLALGLRTEGASRHERDLPLELPEVGRRLAARLLVESGATPSAVVETGEKPGPPRSVTFRPGRVNEVLGSDYDLAQIEDALTPIGLSFQRQQVPKGLRHALKVQVPYWRPDVVEEVDVLEEVARAIGYDAIEERRMVAAPQTIAEGLFRQETALARSLAALGYREIVTISLAGSRVIAAWERSGIPFWTRVAAIQNPLSDDQRFLRPSLLPGALAVAQRSWPKASGSLRIFEIGHIFRPIESEPSGSEHPQAQKPGADQGLYDQNGVLEWPSLCGLALYDDVDADAPIDSRLLEVKGDVETVVSMLTGEIGETVAEARPYFHPGAAGNIVIGDRIVAKFGRLHPRLAHAYELPQASYAFMLYLEHLPQARPVPAFSPLPKFPGTRRDIAVVVAQDVPAGALVRAIREAGLVELEDVTAFDEYRGPQVGAGKKSVALTLRLRKADATITDLEADAAASRAASALARQFGAVLRANPAP